MQVSILGAGPVGLTLAHALARQGVGVTVFERDAAVSRQLRASTFHPPTLDMLDAWGLTAELIAHGRITPRWQIRIHETGEHVDFDLGVLGGETAHPYRLQCEQAVLSDALERRLLALPGVRIVRGVQVAAVGQDESGAWLDVTGSGRQRADFVVGCDGAHSLVRKAIGASFDGDTYPDTTILATTSFDFGAMWPDLAGVNYVWHPSATYSLLHLPAVWRVSLHPLSDEPLEAQATPQRVEARLRELFPGRGPFELLEIRPYRVHKRLASHWRERRLLIAGDAAHLNNPKGGMGMNGGIHDAMALADLLARVAGGEADTVLDAYEAQRLPVVRDDIIGQADRNHARMQVLDLAQRQARLQGLQALVADPVRCRTHLRQTSMLDGLDKARAILQGLSR